MTEINDPFWADDISILFRSDRLIEFFISKEQNVTERLNSITRFAIYAGILLAIYRKQAKYVLISFPIFIITFCIHAGIMSNDFQAKMLPSKIEDQNTVTISDINNKTNIAQQVETDYKGKTVNVDSKLYSISTINNPFGNKLLFDPPNRPPMIDYVSYDKNAIIAKQQVDKNFSINLYEDFDDVYMKKSYERAFYTNPDRGQDIPDQDSSFRNWCYGGISSCKENNNMCMRGINEDLRWENKSNIKPINTPARLK